MAVSIFTGVIQINQLNNNANVSQGKAVANGWAIISKVNITSGQVAGNLNLIPTGANILIDPDLLETNIPNNGFQSPSTGGNAEVV